MQFGARDWRVEVRIDRYLTYFYTYVDDISHTKNNT